LTHGSEQYSEIRLSRGQQTTGEEDFPGEAVAKDPQHLMADVGLEAIEGQEDPALGLSITHNFCELVGAALRAGSG
jgi:hypothetical protein